MDRVKWLREKHKEDFRIVNDVSYDSWGVGQNMGGIDFKYSKHKGDWIIRVVKKTKTQQVNTTYCNCPTKVVEFLPERFSLRLTDNSDNASSLFCWQLAIVHPVVNFIQFTSRRIWFNNMHVIDLLFFSFCIQCAARREILYYLNIIYFIQKYVVAP